MKNTRNILFLCFLIVCLGACNTKKTDARDTATYQCPMKCEGDKTYHQAGTCPVCKMDLQPVEAKVLETGEISDMSVYNLASVWTTQDSTEMKLEQLQGNVVVMVMIYTSCKSACPRLAADMRAIEKQVPEDKKDHLKMVLVSIDPETDTPERLKEFAVENQMDDEQWVFLRGSEEDTREFAAALAVNYKRISPMDFSHSNIISVLDPNGELAYQQEGLGISNEQTVSKILALLH